MERVRIKSKFPKAITSKISKTNYNFHAKQYVTGKVEFLFFQEFSISIKKTVIYTRRLATKQSFYGF